MLPDQTSSLSLSVSHPKDLSQRKQWLDECRDLYSDLRLKVPQLSITPLHQPIATGDRSSSLDLLNNFILAGINIGAFAGLYNLLTFWLENRTTCEITITYPDGFVLKVSKTSLEHAMQLHNSHSREPDPPVITSPPSASR
jgi:hypothetical protein